MKFPLSGFLYDELLLSSDSDVGSPNQLILLASPPLFSMIQPIFPLSKSDSNDSCEFWTLLLLAFMSTSFFFFLLNPLSLPSLVIASLLLLFLWLVNDDPGTYPQMLFNYLIAAPVLYSLLCYERALRALPEALGGLALFFCLSYSSLIIAIRDWLQGEAIISSCLSSLIKAIGSGLLVYFIIESSSLILVSSF